MKKLIGFFAATLVTTLFFQNSAKAESTENQDRHLEIENEVLKDIYLLKLREGLTSSETSQFTLKQKIELELLIDSAVKKKMLESHDTEIMQ